MKLEGLHHLTMITGDAQRNVDFYAGVLGLRLVKKTVNFDSPDAYHLYFGDEVGSPGTILTWFEFPGAWRGRAGAGMIHTIQLGVASEAALDFWAERLRGYGAERAGDSLFFEDYDGLRYELLVSDVDPRRAEHPEIPAEHAITGIVGARAFGAVWRAPAADRDARLHRRRRRLPRGRLHVDLRPRARRARPERRRHRPPHRVGVARRGPPGVARARGRGRDARDHRAGPRLLPLDLLPRAARDPVRDRDAVARLRDRRGPGRTSARSCGCRPSTSTCATQLERVLTPVVNPRAAVAR